MQDGSLKDLAREDVCRLLAACYYQPGPELGEERVFETLERAARLLDPALGDEARALGAAFAAEPLEALLLDYSRLFLGPGEALAKPYGSVWLEGPKVLMGETTVAVRALYREGGFELADDFREVPDHVAAELEFLYLLVFRQNEAARAGDAVAAGDAAALERRLLAGHLARWTGPFTAAIRRSAGTDFYRRLAALTEGLVAFEEARSGAC